MAAKVSDLDRMHELVTKAINLGLDADIEDQIVNPALINAAIKFLKDNEITKDIAEDDDLQTMRNKLVEAAEKRRQKAAGLANKVDELDDLAEG